MAEEKQEVTQTGQNEEQAPPQPPSPKKPNPILKALRENPRLRNVVAYAIMVLLLLLTMWTGSLRAAGARDVAQVNGVDALAAAVTPLLIEKDVVKVERALAKIVKESSYKSITLTDSRGTVKASTDSSRQGERLTDLERAPDKARKFGTPAGPVIRRKVFLAEDNPIGAIEVGLNPE